jgi:hypothetical protein
MSRRPLRLSGHRTSKTICRTHKQRYLTEARAYLALLAARNLRAEQGSDKVEQRVYRCPECNGWHMTSKANEEGKP